MTNSALFKTKTVKIDTLGEYLMSVRNQLNLDVKTVSILAQIKPSYLESLEAGDYAKLPAEVYIRGFLKSLSQLYHIKEQILTDQYEKERGLEPVAVAIVAKNQKLFAFTPRTIIIGVSALLGLAALLYIGNEIRSSEINLAKVQS
jgi:cytoskeletal protein RodZ